MQLSKLYSAIIYWSVMTAGTVLCVNNAQAAQDSKVYETDATQEDYQNIKNGNYSETHKIDVTGLLGFRDLQQDTCKIQIHIHNKDGRYLAHGVTDKFHPENMEEGIPLDQHPVAFVKYQPSKPSENVEIKRYDLKERC